LERHAPLFFSESLFIANSMMLACFARFSCSFTTARSLSVAPPVEPHQPHSALRLQMPWPRFRERKGPGVACQRKRTNTLAPLKRPNTDVTCEYNIVIPTLKSNGLLAVDRARIKPFPTPEIQLLNTVLTSGWSPFKLTIFRYQLLDRSMAARSCQNVCQSKGPGLVAQWRSTK